MNLFFVLDVKFILWLKVIVEFLFLLLVDIVNFIRLYSVGNLLISFLFFILLLLLIIIIWLYFEFIVDDIIEFNKCFLFEYVIMIVVYGIIKY